MESAEFEQILYRWDAESLQKLLVERAPGLIEELKNRCPECRQNGLVQKGAELVCTHCGLVVEQTFIPLNSLPFDTTYALTGKVAIGHSLGGTLPNNQLSQVITKKPTDLVGFDYEDVRFIQDVLDKISHGERVTWEQAEEMIRRYLREIELTHLKTHIQYVEPHPCMKLKEELTPLLQLYGFYSGAIYDEFNHKLADAAGNLADRIGRFLEAGGNRPPNSYRKLAAAILVWLLGGSPNLKGTKKLICKNEDVDEIEVDYVECIAHCPLLSK